MRFIDGLCEGETIRNVYLCKGKRSAETRNGKPYDNLILQDKTGTLDGKVWDPNSQGIADYDEKDFIEVFGDVINYNGNLQLNIRQIRKAEEGEYNPADYMPTTDKSVDGMYEELTAYIRQISNKYLRQVLEFYYIKDEAFIKKFKAHSAAKTVHHGFSGGLLEHTLSVTRMCDYFATSYSILNRDLPFTDEEISAKMVDLLTPAGTRAKVEIVYQTLEGLHASCPNHPGDWYFSGDYPTQGGARMVNNAFIHYMEEEYLVK